MITRTAIVADRSEKQSFDNFDGVGIKPYKGSVLWIDSDAIDDRLLDWLSSGFHLDQYSTEDIRKGGQRVKVEDYDGYAFCIVKSPGKK